MITTESFKCSIPSGDAIKATELNCVGTAPDNYLVLGDVAAWVTAFFTLLLVIGAFMAWHKAKETLAQMQADAAQADNRFETDIRVRAEQLRADKIQESVFEFVSLHQEMLYRHAADVDVLSQIVDRMRLAQTRLEMTMGLYSEQPQIWYFTTAVQHFGQIEYDHRESLGPEYMEAFVAHKGAVSFLFDVMTSLHKGESSVEEVLMELGDYVNRLIETYPHIYDDSSLKGYMKRDGLLNL